MPSVKIRYDIYFICKTFFWLWCYQFLLIFYRYVIIVVTLSLLTLGCFRFSFNTRLKASFLRCRSKHHNSSIIIFHDEELQHFQPIITLPSKPCQYVPLVARVLRSMLFPSLSVWATCQIRKIAGCACAGNAGNVFPTADFKGDR